MIFRHSPVLEYFHASANNMLSADDASFDYAMHSAIFSDDLISLRASGRIRVERFDGSGEGKHGYACIKRCCAYQSQQLHCN